MRASLPALALALALALAAGTDARAADLRRVETVGAVPMRPGVVPRQPPRDAAVQAAVARGVESVALGLLPEGWEARAAGGEPDPSGEDPIPQDPAPDPDAADPGELAPRLAPALGANPFEYATRFRILEDRGTRQALFSRDPEVESEYVVVVEVYVDAGRVRERLLGVGWIEPPAGQASGRSVRLVLEGLGSFAAYDALRRTLLEELAVDAALPVELSRGRAVLAVDGPYDAAALEQALLRRAEPGLRLVPLQRGEQSLTLLIDWTPPPAAPAPDAALRPDAGGPAIDTRRPNRY